jgi:hypothetical protein
MLIKPTITTLQERILSSYLYYRFSVHNELTPRQAARQAFTVWGLETPITPNMEHHSFWRMLLATDGCVEYVVGEWESTSVWTYTNGKQPT